MQGAQLMSKFGINVPEGAAANSIADVVKAADKMKDSKGEVGCSSMTPAQVAFPA